MLLDCATTSRPPVRRAGRLERGVVVEGLQHQHQLALSQQLSCTDGWLSSSLYFRFFKNQQQLHQRSFAHFDASRLRKSILKITKSWRKALLKAWICLLYFLWCWDRTVSRNREGLLFTSRNSNMMIMNLQTQPFSVWQRRPRRAIG